MKLTKAHVRDFHSVRDSNEFEVGDVTCLVGKNESGKTALLRAMYQLRPIVSGDLGYSVTDDYPRRDVADYEEAVKNGDRLHAVVARLTFKLDDDDVAVVAERFGLEALLSRTITIEKAYGQERFGCEMRLDGHKALQHLLASFQVPAELGTKLAKCANVPAVRTTLNDEEQTEAVQSILEWCDAIEGAGSIDDYVFNQLLNPRIPRFLYFDEYYQMEGCANIEALKQRREQKKLRPADHPMIGLINLARLDLDALLNPDRTRELKNKLEGAGNHLTRSIVKYWSQNKHLQMQFDVRPAQAGDPEGMRDGTNIWADVYDTRHMVTTELGTRSRGFVWFFSFLAWYGDVKREKQNVILLLDEPGMSLHGKAQGDLLGYIEAELAPNHQVIYTTHSPFMVDAGRFDRVRIVQDLSVTSEEELPPEKEGTKVITEVLEASDDSLFPLQGALGYDITQTLFVGPNCLVVEGVSDLLYLQVMSGVLDGEDREGLLEDWTITPVGGADKVPTFVALLGSQAKLNIATLIDFQEKDRQTIDDLYRRKLIKKKKVLTYADFVAGNEADVEDVIGEAFYIELVNGEYADALQAPITAGDLTSNAPRIVIRVEDFLTGSPLKGGGGFNHYRPARYLTDHAGTVTIPDDVKDRFEALFKAVNKLVRY